jgi:hypothetical protein
MMSAHPALFDPVFFAYTAMHRFGCRHTVKKGPQFSGPQFSGPQIIPRQDEFG